MYISGVKPALVWWRRGGLASLASAWLFEALRYQKTITLGGGGYTNSSYQYTIDRETLASR